tara:strand:- start:548 stop:886 length:339 start_codon:yes stop_codon:yes gene_type:complete
MPLIRVQTSLGEIENTDDFLKGISSEVSNCTGKPEKYVMTFLQTNVPMTFGGSASPCCFVEIKSIGSLKPSLMTERICKLISSKTEIPSNRIYIAFEDVEASKWGFNGGTFG